MRVPGGYTATGFRHDQTTAVHLQPCSKGILSVCDLCTLLITQICTTSSGYLLAQALMPPVNTNEFTVKPRSTKASWYQAAHLGPLPFELEQWNTTCVYLKVNTVWLEVIGEMERRFELTSGRVGQGKAMSGEMSVRGG